MVSLILQDVIAHLSVWFKKHKFTLEVGIVNMYRKVKALQENTHLKLIIRKGNPQDDVNIFMLENVQYNTAQYLL